MNKKGLVWWVKTLGLGLVIISMILLLVTTILVILAVTGAAYVGEMNYIYMAIAGGFMGTVGFLMYFIPKLCKRFKSSSVATTPTKSSGKKTPSKRARK